MRIDLVSEMPEHKSNTPVRKIETVLNYGENKPTMQLLGPGNAQEAIPKREIIPGRCAMVKCLRPHHTVQEFKVRDQGDLWRVTYLDLTRDRWPLAPDLGAKHEAANRGTG
jgi:hypothetical protein